METQEFDEVHDIEEPKRIRLSLHLLQKRHLPAESANWTQEKIVDALNKISHVRLDRESIGIIDGLELLGTAVTNLYLQHNYIEKIENLELLPNLTFVTLAANQVRHIQGLRNLKKLGFLDLSENLIESLDIEELPLSLVILNLQGNQCTRKSDYRDLIVQDLPKLRQLDGKEVTREEREEAGYILPAPSDSEDESEESGESESDNDHEIGNLHDFTSGLIENSKQRMRTLLKTHHEHQAILEDLRSQSTLPAESARSSRTPSTRSVADNINQTTTRQNIPPPSEPGDSSQLVDNLDYKQTQTIPNNADLKQPRTNTPSKTESTYQTLNRPKSASIKISPFGIPILPGNSPGPSPRVPSRPLSGFGSAALGPITSLTED